MNGAVERPIYYENQILGAVDLTAALDHNRGQEARHNRYLHLWGIATGLELSGEDKSENNENYKIITLSPGMAIDGSGREIVVPKSEQLSGDKFSQLQLTGGLDLEEAWFPVFLVAQEKPAATPPIATAKCDNSLPTRMVEGYDVTFGRPGSARDLDKQNEALITDGPAKGGWKILLGYVQSNKNGDQFSEFKYEVNGIGRRYAGVQADEVAARGGALEIRTRSTKQANKPALVLNEEKDGLLQFGSFNPQGRLLPVLTVDAQGNLKVEGKISGALTTGGVQVESGIATDGMILPLPPGITEKQVADGEAVVQSLISLQLGENAAPVSLTGNLAATPLEQWVDTDRRVHCRLRWFQIGGAAPVIEDHPATCNYIVLASVKEKKA
jgi:hypothetical protein